MKSSFQYDIIIIGAGIGGVTMLRYCIQSRLKVLVIEKSSEPGGLWRDLPTWQDIQSRKEDWTLNNIPIESERQKDICSNIICFIDKYKLEDHIRFSEPVVKVHHCEGHD